ncbi:MAG: ADP-ribosylglycohydrolase family protein [Methanomicrobiales archaeon]|nr:ADP-ribosylglycohydrolase family protein [Methanomicrobiales archaeon]
MTEARIRGGLIGLAVGDALGAPLEGLPPPAILVRDMTGGGPHGRKKGSVTDDTLQALAVARSLIVCQGFQTADLVPRLLESYLQDPSLYGPTSREVFELALRGVSFSRAALFVHEKRGSRTNGSVMRGPPLGLWYRDIMLVRSLSIACSRLTHLDPVAGECSAVVNVIVSRVARGASRESAFREALAICEDKEVAGMLSRYRQTDPDPSLDALLTTHAAVSLFLAADSLEDAVLSAINLGGDADTVGAVCGSLSGAYWGYPSIPCRWLADLECLKEIDAVAIQLWQAAEK